MRTFLAVLLLTTSLAASAWNDDAHRLICQLAFEKLSDTSKEFVQQTLAMGTELDGNGKNDLAEACVWADSARGENYRGTWEQHFIRVPGSANTVDFLRDCAALDCIAVGIQRHLTYLARPAVDPREKARKAAALRFLGHFVGDLYQPLNVGHLENQGGKSIAVEWFGEDTNLFLVWNSLIIERAGISYPDSLDEIAATDVQRPQNNVLQALQQSFKLANSHAYANIDGSKVKSGDVLGEAYFERSKRVVMQQFARSATLLAHLINGVVDGSQDTNILVE